ncbi:MAG: transporter substrate-binding domain-containing protein [Geminicoccaceae bacterium]|nr:transporter substrate-binding domain-containing protein [Geminicoccaceae bacterium]
MSRPRGILWWLVLALLLASAPTVVAAGTITLRADPWCPHNCRPESDRPGYLIELARAIFEPLGHRVDYRAMGWRRTIEAVRAGEIDGAVGAGLEDAPDLVFADEPAGLAVPVIAVRRGEGFTFTGPGSLGDRVIGAILGYEFGGPLEPWLRRHARDPTRIQWVSGIDGAVQNLKKLLAGRIDGMLDDRAVIAHYATELGLRERIELVELGVYQPIGIAFSPAKPEGRIYARAFGEGLRRLRASGELAAILGRYGLVDDRPGREPHP